MIIQRSVLRDILETLVDVPLVVVQGPRRSGKSTLARQLERASIGRASLVEGRGRGALALDPGLGLRTLLGGSHGGNLLIVDDADKVAGLLGEARRLAPELARGSARLVLLGSGGEDAAAALPGGLEARLELRPLSLAEAGQGNLRRRWLRGGLPESLLALTEEASAAFRARYLEDLGASRLLAALPWSPGRGEALLRMLAAGQGQARNDSALAASLGVGRSAVAKSLLALEEAGYLRLLPAHRAGPRKRLRHGPWTYLRDSGLFHALADLQDERALLGSPLLSASWEGFVLEELCAHLPPGTEARRYLSQDGASLELVVLRGGDLLAGVGIRWSRLPGTLPRGLLQAAKDLGPRRRFLVLPEYEGRDEREGFEVLGVAEAVKAIGSL